MKTRKQLFYIFMAVILVDGVLGTDFLEKHKAIIDYSRSALYLKTNP